MEPEGDEQQQQQAERDRDLRQLQRGDVRLRNRPQIQNIMVQEALHIVMNHRNNNNVINIYPNAHADEYLRGGEVNGVFEEELLMEQLDDDSDEDNEMEEYRTPYVGEGDYPLASHVHIVAIVANDELEDYDVVADEDLMQPPPAPPPHAGPHLQLRPPPPPRPTKLRGLFTTSSRTDNSHYMDFGLSRLQSSANVNGNISGRQGE